MAVAVPEKVRATFEKVRERYPFYVQLTQIKGHFYVYRHSSVYDGSSHKSRATSVYLGRIDPAGNFVEKTTIAEIAALHTSATQRKEGLKHGDLEILTSLSMNCRMPMEMLAERAGLGMHTAANRVRRLEQLLGLRYFTSIDYSKFGFSLYVAMVRFINAPVQYSEIGAAIRRRPEVQLALSTSGKYDLLIFFLAENNEGATRFIYDLRSDPSLEKHDSLWNVTFFYNTYGQIPIRQEFFDFVLSKKVWHRSKGSLKPGRDSIFQREFAVLKELSANGRMPFAEVDRKYRFGKGSSMYTFERLREQGIILWSTMLIENPGARYNGLLLTGTVNHRAFVRSREALLQHIISEGKGMTNRFALVGDTGISYGALFVMPIFHDGELESEAASLSAAAGGVRVHKHVITEVLCGRLCYRRIDNEYSSQYAIIAKEYKRIHIKEKETYYGK